MGCLSTPMDRRKCDHDEPPEAISIILHRRIPVDVVVHPRNLDFVFVAYGGIFPDEIVSSSPYWDLRFHRWCRITWSCNAVIQLFEEGTDKAFYRKKRRRFVHMSCSYLQGRQEVLDCKLEHPPLLSLWIQFWPIPSLRLPPIDCFFICAHPSFLVINHQHGSYLCQQLEHIILKKLCKPCADKGKKRGHRKENISWISHCWYIYYSLCLTYFP